MIYGVYLAFSTFEVYGAREKGEKAYPREFGKVVICKNEAEQLDVYANTMCSASQLVEAETKEEFDKKVEELKVNFENEKWLDENIYPYI